MAVEQIIGIDKFFFFFFGRQSQEIVELMAAKMQLYKFASINEILVRSLQLNDMFLGATNPPFLCKFRVRGHV